jgi:hypothetical protein
MYFWFAFIIWVEISGWLTPHEMEFRFPLVRIILVGKANSYKAYKSSLGLICCLGSLGNVILGVIHYLVHYGIIPFLVRNIHMECMLYEAHIRRLGGNHRMVDIWNVVV